MAANGRRAKKTRTLCARGRPTIRICLSLEPRRRGLFLTIAARHRVHSFPSLTLHDLAIPALSPAPSTEQSSMLPFRPPLTVLPSSRNPSSV
jgi:hypothetical protein